jgi:hypothetical protein
MLLMIVEFMQLVAAFMLTSVVVELHSWNKRYPVT